MIEIYSSFPQERAEVERIVRNAGNLFGEELTIPLELFDGYIRDAKVSGYYFLSAKLNDKMIGFACYGPTSLTDSTFDLYWIVAEANEHGKGVGRALFDRVVEEIKNRKGEMLVIWTSSTPHYDRARKFYERMGCKVEARLRDYYRMGDDLCVYVYRIENGR